ncbi:MAG: MerR family transcriptional regulator [Candidatus Marinimicrobia bacterium]|jgi:DNA-binding transcriptional MerR regulator|nr:MerR family transcriptional regulator [Candidatus Neomarinimicrobiota bacterium]MBT3946519.1 MerR family transcriptional regulator [Candidatus Neomarinimicrobiota bacterium]MBT4154701.1 MerR family transcriptional regulator [Candidatus Neomarinimicrobiota bacterium]MBT4554966.1 MerR family transcriptional regulator [Candidatus Neomarinimicrobiota bacterium]MBT4753252.1 MerR family transcriptional regulator [Candidatus Neomarinimicrobiota bacterium]|tara:strand:+ start:10540 stop:10902 length:363 start_codon:yes stop_codon:yes gene_type:complete
MTKVQPKVKKLYYSIGEVSELTKLKAYVLRYWETEFSQLSPPKNRAGNRTYRQKDIDMILNIKDLLYVKKFTIDGARSVLSGKEVAEDNSQKTESFNEKQKIIFRKIKGDLTAILKIITE